MPSREGSSTEASFPGTTDDRAYAAEAVDCARAWTWVGMRIPAPQAFDGTCAIGIGLKATGDVRVTIGYDGELMGRFRLVSSAPSGASRYELSLPTAGAQQGSRAGITLEAGAATLMTSNGLRLTRFLGEESAAGPEPIAGARSLPPLRVVRGEGGSGEGVASASFAMRFRKGQTDFKQSCRFGAGSAGPVTCRDAGGMILTGTFALDAAKGAVTIALVNHAARHYQLEGENVLRRLVPLPAAGPRVPLMPKRQAEICGQLRYVDPEDEDAPLAGLWLVAPQGRYRLRFKGRESLRESLREAAPAAVCIRPASPPKAATATASGRATVAEFRVMPTH